MSVRKNKAGHEQKPNAVETKDIKKYFLPLFTFILIITQTTKDKSIIFFRLLKSIKISSSGRRYCNTLHITNQEFL